MSFADMLKGVLGTPMPGMTATMAPGMGDVAPENAPEGQVSQFPSDEDIVADVNERFDKFKYGRIGFERNWFENILFRHGNQWIINDGLGTSWRKMKLKPYIPTPVTNKFAATGERVASVLSRIQPNWTFVPATDDETSIVSAKKADQLEEVICEENDVDGMRKKIAKWLTYTGNCFVFSNVTVKENGENKQYSDIFSPFEVYGNIQIEDIDNHPAIIICTIKDKQYIKDKWGVDAENSEIREVGLYYLERLAYVSQNNSLNTSQHMKNKGALIKIAIVRPCEKYPEGLIAFISGSNVLEKNTFVKNAEGDYIFPLEHYKFDYVPGSWLASTPMFDLVAKQRQRNRVESMMELIMMRMSNPVWIMSAGTKWVNGATGEPGAQLVFQQMGDKALPPQRMAGENIPASSFNFLDKLDKDFEDLASTFEALKGQAPYSGAPNVAIETLIEQGLTRFGPALADIANSWRRWMKTQIELYRIYGGNRVFAKMGEGSQWEFKKFEQADFMGAVNVRIESDSTVPRNEYVKQAKISVAIQEGIVDMADPIVKLKALQKLKLEDLAGDTDADVIAAVQENESLLATPQMRGMPPAQLQVTPFIDNHKIHIAKHRLFAMSEQGKPFLQQLVQHITEHNMYMDAEMNGTPMPQGNNPRQVGKGQQEALAGGGDKQLENIMAPSKPQMSGAVQ